MEHAFDTLAFAKRLEAVGFTRQQAETLADEQNKLIDERLATKRDIGDIRADIEVLRLETKRDMGESEVKLEAKIAETKADIIKWVIGIGFAQTAMIVAVLKLHG